MKFDHSSTTTGQDTLEYVLYLVSILTLSISIRPLLKFAVPAWSPSLSKDIKALEKIQHRATKSLHSLSKMQYADRCLKMNLPILVDRRDRGDLIQMYKFEKGINSIKWQLPLIRASSRAVPTRELEEINQINKRNAFFTNRVANSWNELDDATIISESTNMFKNHFDNFIKAKNRQ